MLVHRRLRIKLTHTSKNGDEQKTTSSELDLEGIHSIAVLPFQPLNVNDADDVFGLGLTDALIMQMNRGGQMQVRPTSSILKYNLLEQNPVSAGRELQVNAVLEGRFQRIENKLRLTVQLLRTADGTSLWADGFNAEVDDIFTVQDLIAERVLGSLTKKLTGEAMTRIRRRYTENVDAYREYLQGRGFWNKRTIEDYYRALGCFQKAIEIDPAYALAYAGIADLYNLLSLYDGGAPHDSFPKAKAAALKALFIDQNLAEAHTALGLAILHYDWNWLGAEASFRNAIKLNPNYAAAYQLLGVYLCRVDRISEAIVALKQAQELDPLSPIHATWLAEVLRYCGETEGSIRLHLETLKSFPDFYLAHYHLAFSYIDCGRFEDAEAHREKAVSLSNENSLTLSLQGILQAATNDEAAVRETLNKLLRIRTEKYIGAVNIASVYAASGDEEKTLEWLGTAVRERDPNLTWIKFDKEFGFLSQDPRFRKILQTVGLIEPATILLPPAIREASSMGVRIMAGLALLGITAIVLVYFFSISDNRIESDGTINLTRNIAEDNMPAWSPDGKKIAFISNRDGAGEVYVMDASGANVIRLTHTPAIEYTAAWSPDGSKLIFDSERDGNRELYVMNADGSNQSRLTFNPSSDAGLVSFSPDGRQFVFARSPSNERSANYNYDIFIMNADGGGEKQLTRDTKFDAEPRWSPDGKTIQFISDRDGDFEIYTINSDGTGEANLSQNSSADYFIAWTPDGKQLICMGDAEKREFNQIYVLNPDGTGRRQITSFNDKIFRAAYSPTAQKFAILSTRDGNYEIYLMEAKTLFND